MANLVSAAGLGRVGELYKRVDTADPTNCALIIAVLATTGVEADSVLRDKADFAALVSGTTNYVTNSGYARKVLTGADLVAIDPDEANDRLDLDIPDQTWTGVAAGDGWNDIVIGYDNDTTGGTDANIEFLTIHDFVVVPDGSDITAQIAATGFFRAANL